MGVGGVRRGRAIYCQWLLFIWLNTSLCHLKFQYSEPLANLCVYGLKPDYIIIQINDILEASAVWKIYKEQKHDLFLSDNSVAGYLMGPTGVAGYLTAGTTNTSSAPLTAPPPLSPPDDTTADAREE